MKHSADKRILKTSFWLKSLLFLCLISVIPFMCVSFSFLSHWALMNDQFLSYEESFGTAQPSPVYAKLKLSLNELYSNMRFEYFIIVVLSVGVAGLLLYAFLHKLKHYMSTFMYAFSQIEKCQYAYRLPVHRGDECEYLVAQFNEMMSRLSRSDEIFKKLFNSAYPTDDKAAYHPKSLEVIQSQLQNKNIYFMVYEQLNEAFFMILDLSREEQSLHECLFQYCKKYVHSVYVGKAKCNLEKLCSDLDQKLYALSENDPLQIPSSFGIIDMNNMVLRYVNCGFKGGVLFKTNSIELLSSQESVLGSHGEKYQQFEVHLQRGNVLLFSVSSLRIESQPNAYTLTFDATQKEISGKYLNDIILGLIYFVQDSDLCTDSVLFKIMDPYRRDAKEAFFSKDPFESPEHELSYSQTVEDSRMKETRDIPPLRLDTSSRVDVLPTGETHASILGDEGKENIHYMRRYLENLSSDTSKHDR